MDRNPEIKLPELIAQEENEKHPAEMNDQTWNSIKKEVDWPTPAYSDHVPVKRKVNEVLIVTWNCSFYLLQLQYVWVKGTEEEQEQMIKDLRDKQNLDGPSEELMARAFMKKTWKPFELLPIDNFLKKAKKEQVDVLLLQEWPMDPRESSSLSGKTHEWAVQKLKSYDFEPKVETFSGQEGSCIAAAKKESITVTPVVNGDGPSGMWSWCGVKGRTWSVAKVKTTAAEGPGFLCFNVHAPSGIDGKYKMKKIEGPAESTMIKWFQTKAEENFDYNCFRLDPVGANQEYLKQVFKLEQYQAIQEEYRTNGGKVVIGGDWNNQYTAVNKIRDRVNRSAA